MTELTALDHAHAQMQAAPDDDAARLRFYERLADSELFLLLAREAEGDTVEPDLFDLGDARFVLVFDREERLAQFAERIVPSAALSGRAVVSMLAGQGIGLGVNLQVAPSEILIPAEAVDWLSQTLDSAPKEEEARPQEFAAPSALPSEVLSAIDTKLATAAGLARSAYLAEVAYQGGQRGHILGFTGTLPGAEPALATAVNEALVFSGVPAASLDVVFLSQSDPAAASLARVGLRFDIPQRDTPDAAKRAAPGSNPDVPPILR